MIVVDLICEHKHRFEGWFASSEALEAQQQNGQLSCPICASTAIQRLPSAPFVGRRATDRQPDPALEQTQHELAEAQSLLRTLVQRLHEQAMQAEDVGQEFTVEVRRIHNGQAEDRIVRGVASLQEVEALLEEGIGVLPLGPAKEDLH